MDDIFSDGYQMSLRITDAPGCETLIEFIGAEGKILAKAYDTFAAYAFSGDEQYVRARVSSSCGGMAWIQPIFLKPEKIR